MQTCSLPQLLLTGSQQCWLNTTDRLAKSSSQSIKTDMLWNKTVNKSPLQALQPKQIGCCKSSMIHDSPSIK